MRRPPPVLVVLALLLLAAIGGVLWWLPFDPFEGDAGTLDQLVPEDVDAVLRFDPAAVSESAAARTVWEHPALRGLVAASGIEERVFAPLRALEDRVGAATLGLAPQLGRDVFGQEVVLALRDDDVLLLSRVTDRARTLDLIRRLDSAELRAMGLHVDGDIFVLSREDAPTVYFGRYRDVLAASTERGMVDGMSALGEMREEFGPRSVPFAEALDCAHRPGARLLLWAQPAALAQLVESAPPADAAADSGDDRDGVGGGVGGDGPDDEDLAGLWRRLLPPDGLRPVQGAIDCTSDGTVSVVLTTAYADDAPEELAALPSALADRAGDLQAEAERLAVPGEAMVVTGLAVRAEDVVRTLVRAQPPARRDLLVEMLADEGQTVDSVARALAVYLEDGVAAVVARLPEVDDLDLETADGGLVLPIPATLVAFRLRDPAAGAAVIDRLRDDAHNLFGAELDVTADELPDGGRLYRLAGHPFGGEWALLTPAFAVDDGWFIFCTNESYLTRAVAWSLGGEADGPGVEAGGTARVRIDGAPLYRHVLDRRWEWAQRETYHDWKREREALRAELDAKGGFLSPEDRRIYEDARIELRLATRKQVEFPAAIERYRERWRPLAALGALRLGATLRREGIALRIDLDVGR